MAGKAKAKAKAKARPQGPKAKPKGPWTAEEVARNERANQIRAGRDRARGMNANLEDTVKLTRFANRLAKGFKDARGA